MLVKSTYLSILGIAILAWLQVTVVNIASFTTLRLRNAKRRNTDKFSGHQEKKLRMYSLKTSQRASKASTTGGHFCERGEHPHTTLSKKPASYLCG